jgi:4-amino-4-deoxychorismate lyase
VESAFRDPGLKLIETFGWDGNAYPRLPRHLARMKESAQVLGFPCDSDVLSAALPPDPGSEPLRLRLTLSRQGEVDLTSAPLAQNPPEWRVAIAPSRVVSADPRLAHKTTDRALYDQTRARLPQGIDEMLFLNERDEVAEGTITNLFFDLGSGLSTPPLSSGCLPGCLRAELIETGQVREAILLVRDLPIATLFVGNSLRGLVAARLAT